MNTIVIEHVSVSDLPAAWRAKRALSADAHVTVPIEEESQIAAATTKESVTDDPTFGIWRDREDIDDMAAYLRKLRAPRYNRDGSRNAP